MREIVARHGIAWDSVRPSPVQGEAARVWLLGDAWVLKVAREGFADDLRKEALVIPFAVRGGLRTPALRDWGEEPLPWLLAERAPGRPADGGEPGDAGLRALGRELATLHSAEVPDEVRAGVPADVPGDPRVEIEALAGRGYLSPALADWLNRWLDRLAGERGERAEGTLIHGDIAAGNLLFAEDGSLTALLDWGDAAWADPAVEFAKVPPRRLPPVLTGYLDDGSRGGRQTLVERGPGLVADVLWHQLSWAVLRLPGKPRPEGAHWSAQPANRLLELLRLYAEELPEPWAGWMRSQRLP
ncbi:Phosphotransferase enzyme family protein [Streptomyces zhaozhouensis]|uniref:Phosphotransferase enzyme family protein n=1 Tax=Streptomyces zhaozhouensis TaxID=1300267 RepID=A0A286DYQ6_9ACTN|nr:Phosphotransferase enzyme family protein [Streptomyces zhaozhouensis]